MKNEFTRLVNAAIELNKITREASNKYAYSVPLCSYLRDHATVKLSVGRNTGKTTYIRDHAGPDDLVLVNNAFFAKNFGNCLAKVISPTRDFNSLIGINAKIIWIDEPTLVEDTINNFWPKDIGMVYEVLGRNKDQTFVFLGE